MYVPQVHFNQHQKTIQYNSAAAAWIAEHAPNETKIHLLITYQTLGLPVPSFTYRIQPMSNTIRRVKEPRNLYQYGPDDNVWKTEPNPFKVQPQYDDSDWKQEPSREGMKEYRRSVLQKRHDEKIESGNYLQNTTYMD